jgi:tetratricopeptide (TPR) repeat protein
LATIPPDPKQLFAEAERYRELGDTYHAVKLYKRVIKLVKDWVAPYLALGRIYKERREWKPAFHYFKKTVALKPQLREAWWSLAIAATALKKDRVARSIWAKFGMQDMPHTGEGLQLAYRGTFEILWMRAQDPAKAHILSIPHPDSGFRFRDIVLYERKPVGHHVVGNERIPVYAELGVFKRSPYQTFSCLLHAPTPEQLKKLEEMCFGARLGFEIWSNAARSMVVGNPKAFPEYYSRAILPPDEARTDDSTSEHVLVGLAATHEAEVFHVLDAWEIVALGSYSDLCAY